MTPVELAKESLVKPFEGFASRLPDGRCRAYPDPGSGKEPWTIGWGCTGPNITKDTIWTVQEAEIALTKHLEYFAIQLLKLSPTLINYPNPFAACISFVYNCGIGNYRISTFKKKIDAQDWLGAREEIVKWNKASGKVMRGLTLRRQAEATLIN